MIPVDLAVALRAAGLAWTPAQGDCFAVPDRDLDGQVFWLADMVISRLDVPGGPPVLAFNGTTEWALDSLEVDEALWLPREDQLRERLGESFGSLQRVPGAAGGWVVTLATGEGPGSADGSADGDEDGDERAAGLADWHADTSPAAAYGRALLALLAARSAP